MQCTIMDQLAPEGCIGPPLSLCMNYSRTSQIWINWKPALSPQWTLHHHMHTQHAISNWMTMTITIMDQLAPEGCFRPPLTLCMNYGRTWTLLEARFGSATNTAQLHARPATSGTHRSAPTPAPLQSARTPLRRELFCSRLVAQAHRHRTKIQEDQDVHTSYVEMGLLIGVGCGRGSLTTLCNLSNFL